jgi:hypothetical protein
MKNAIVSTLVIAAVSTAGDFVWATWLPRPQMIAGLIHGALLCLAAGLALGLPVRRPAAGAAAGLIVGFLAAASYYALAPLLGFGAMLPAWFLLWMLLSVTNGMVLRRERRAGAALARGAIAGVASGLAFYAVSGMWRNWDPASINYAEHFLRWVVAFAPGFAALQVPVLKRAKQPA